MSSSGSDFWSEDWSDEIDWSDDHEEESSEIISNELVIAASEGLLDKVNFLIGSGHDAKDKFGAAALLGAAANGHAAVVTSLLEAGAPIDARSKSSHRTPLINAAEYSHVKVVEILLAAGANIKAFDISGRSAFCVAAHNPTTEVAESLLRSAPVDCFKDRIFYKTKMTLLVDASRWGRTEMVELLLAAGGNFTERNLHSALCMATFNDRIEVVCVLIKAGAKLDMDQAMETPLFLAVERGYADIIHELLAAGADPDGGSYSIERHPNGRRTRKGIELTPLMVAARDKRLDFVHTLLEGGANVNLVAKDGNAALKEGVISDDFEVVKALSNAGADPFVQTDPQNLLSLLHYACSGAVQDLLMLEMNQRKAAALSVMPSKIPLHVRQEILRLSNMLKLFKFEPQA